MKYYFPTASLLVFAFLAVTFQGFAASPKKIATPVPVYTPTPQPQPTAIPTVVMAPDNINVPKTLVVHKPLPNPAWGKVVQYHREQNFALADKSWETLHEFVFQDSNGVVRTATYHETSSGDGYWEVWVWDRP